MKKSIVILLTILVIAGAVILFAYRYTPKEVVGQRPPVEKTKNIVHKPNVNIPNWIGSWERRDWQEGSTLEIKNVTPDSLFFDLTAYNGGHTGEIEGSAHIKNNEAVFMSAKDMGCRLTMRMQGDSVINIADNNTCLGYGGIGVGFAGKFINVKILPKEKKQTLVSLAILNTEQDAVFRVLVDTNYQKFVDCTHLIADRTGEKYLDNFDATVISSGVRGLYTFMEYIIMIDKQNQIWAAIIDNEKVLYYTNSKNYTDKLPNTIEDWRSGFKDYPVIYVSKK